MAQQIPVKADPDHRRLLRCQDGSGPEGVRFVPASQSPISRLLPVAGNESGGTTAIYDIR